MNRTRTLLMLLGLISGMVFVYGLDILTTRLPANLEYHFKPWNILTYNISAEIDNLTVMEKNGRKVPVRYQYSEEMELRCYHYHTMRSGKRIILTELISKKIAPKSITVDGKDETQKHAGKFARRTPPPRYNFLQFEKTGLIPGQRRASAIRDMIVSSYHVRNLPKGRSLTGDTWSGEMDMGPFITTYKWEFDSLDFNKDRDEFANITGGGEFFEELPDGVKGAKLGSFKYSYTIGVSLRAKREGFVRKAEGSFDINSKQDSFGTSYREEFAQKLVSIDAFPTKNKEKLRDQLEALSNVMKQEELGDAQAFHDSLVIYLRKFRDTPLWDNVFSLLNALREKCGEKPFKKKDIFKQPEDGSEED